MVPARNRNWLPSIFNDFFGDEWMSMHTKQQAAPAVNIIEQEKSYCIEVAAPGMCREDFTVRIEDDNQLVIALEKKSSHDSDSSAGPAPAPESGEKREEKRIPAEKRSATYLRRDFSYTSFRQSFMLPDEVDRSKIAARMHHGVLTIELPKKETAHDLPTSRRIEIR